jgi:hypothetical protein
VHYLSRKKASVWLTVALTSALLGVAGCRNKKTQLLTVDDLVHKYVLSVAELGERDPDSLDFYIGSDASVNQARSHPETLVRLHSEAVTLSSQVRRFPETAAFDAKRKSLLIAQIDAIALRTDQLRGINRPFDEESRGLFGVVAPIDIDAGSRKIARTKLAALLGNAANPAKAYSQFDRKFVIPADRVPIAMEAALQQCRELTMQHMALPSEEHVDVEYVFHKPWSAFSRYLGNARSLIQVNMDYPITVDRLLNLACHEGYPGHHVFNLMRDERMLGRFHRGEFLVQPTFSPQSYVSEASATYGPSLLLSDAERLRIERDVLFPIAGIKRQDCKRYLEVQQLITALHTAEPSIAREYLDGRLEFVRAADALEREMLMEHGETTLLYLNEYRTYMLSYTLGADSVRSLVEQGHPTDAVRWQRYTSLMTNPVISLPLPGRP